MPFLLFVSLHYFVLLFIRPSAVPDKMIFSDQYAAVTLYQPSRASVTVIENCSL
jgi:hypothetical protein